MKKTGLNIVLLLFFQNVLCQNYVLEYTLKYRTDSTQTSFQQDNYYLIFDNENKKTKFFNAAFLKQDSLNQGKPSNEKNNVLPDFPIKITHDLNTNTFIHYTSVGIDNYQYPTTDQVNWKITDSIKEVSGFTSQLALADFKGRKWNAFFTNDIPLPIGPYTFYGLPGLITQISDTTQSYIFQLTGVKKVKHAPNTEEFLETPLGFINPIKISSEGLKKILKDRYKDPYRDFRDPNFQSPFTSADLVRMTKERQKEIRQNNNPIELSEAIHYDEL